MSERVCAADQCLICSSAGMMDENGPFNVRGTVDNKTVVTKNPYSWNQASWMLYVDQPVRVGAGAALELS